MIPNLTLFSGRLFGTDGEEAAPNVPKFRDASMLGAVGEAEASLRAELREDGELLSPEAWNDLRVSLSEFLQDLLLIDPTRARRQKMAGIWVEAQREMLSRLRSDKGAIGAWLSSECGRVMKIEAGLSDRHNGGRTVAIFTFESGPRVVYKPREMGIEDWYCRFAAWLNEAGAPFAIRAARVMTRPGYGWMEFVPHERCRSEAELRRYYRNAGALLCVLHVLRARDCHFQNLIACGEHPVMVDAEMLFQAQISEGEAATVTQTGLIPSFRFGPEGEHYDVSGLGFVERKATHFGVPHWSASGVRFAMGVLEPRESVPLMVGHAARPQDFVSEMTEGFTRTYRFFADAPARRNELVGLIRTASALPVRCLVRETMEYYQALSFEIGGGGQVVLPEPAGTREVFSGLRQQEIAALERLDVPRFVLGAGERSLCGLKDCFFRSGVEAAVAGIEDLSEADLAKQIRHLRLSWSLSRVSASLV